MMVRARCWGPLGLRRLSHDESGLAQYWRDMDRRVSNRKPREVGPLAKVGRGPRRAVDPWGAVGPDDFFQKAPSQRQSVAGRLSRGRVQDGKLDEALDYYEERVLPILRKDPEFIDLRLVADRPRRLLQSLSTWRSDDAFSRVAGAKEYLSAMRDFAAFFEDVQQLESDDVHVVTHSASSPDDDDDK